jgi:hypothetical protein
MRRILAAALFSTILTIAADAPPVYWLLWFDTEDYVDPASDDAALRLARELDAMGVRATFKVVGEKARVLEERGRRDVIAALSKHDIGYHTNYHSIPPAPAVYLQKLGMADGAREFERREASGVEDIRRIFGVTPSSYGQPGNSWAPQTNVTLRKWGIPVYMDDGDQVGFDGQPFWFGGILYAFNLKNFTMRADLNDPALLGDAKSKFDAAVAAAKARGGGVLQSYYHPTEWSSTEFWDGVNFKYGANTPRNEWKKPQARTPESREQAFRIFFEFVKHVKNTPGVRIVTARDLPQLVENPLQRPISKDAATSLLAKSLDAHESWSAADLLLAALDVRPRYVDGPDQRGETSAGIASTIPRWLFDKTKADAKAYIETHGKLPSYVWAGNDSLSLADFAATLASAPATGSVPVRKGDLLTEQRIAKDAGKAYNWVIHAKGFAPADLLDLARLQAWTLKPAKLRETERASFVPAAFEVPRVYETAKYKLVPLGPELARQDYEAYMSSIEHLQQTFTRSKNWPRAGLTMADAIKDVEGEKARFDARRSFTYAIVTLDGKDELGCLYLSPSRQPDADAVARLWVTKARFDAGFEREVLPELKSWIAAKWPFRAVAWPGRD